MCTPCTVCCCCWSWSLLWPLSSSWWSHAACPLRWWRGKCFTNPEVQQHNFNNNTTEHVTTTTTVTTVCLPQVSNATQLKWRLSWSFSAPGGAVTEDSLHWPWTGTSVEEIKKWLHLLWKVRVCQCLNVCRFFLLSENCLFSQKETDCDESVYPIRKLRGTNKHTYITYTQIYTHTRTHRHTHAVLCSLSLCGNWCFKQEVINRQSKQRCFLQQQTQITASCNWKQFLLFQKRQRRRRRTRAKRGRHWRTFRQ